MILYNVTVMVDAEVAADWLEWMRTHHIPEVMNSGYFLSHRLCRLLQPEPEQNTVTYAIQYFCISGDKLNEYIVQAAPALRDKHSSRYGHKAQVFRTVLEILSDDPAFVSDTLG
jgi:hypothetical protein